MKKILVLLLLFPFCVVAYSQSTLTPGAALLFGQCKSVLTVEERNGIYKSLGFVLSGDATQPFALDKESKDFPFTVMVFPTDLNKDGKEELFISFGNSYTSGNTGSSIAFFVKDAKNVYTNQFGFPGTLPDVLATLNKGYPDLLIGGPGFEFPVWRWNGSAYVLNRKIKNAEYEQLKKQSVEEISIAYQQTIKH